MTIRISRDPIYRRRRFSAEIIELCVRWYITYRLSYRDLAAMMAESEIVVSHTTVMRWVLRYVPEYECRWARFARSPGLSWRMDETAVYVRGGRHYLYRAVDGKKSPSRHCSAQTEAWNLHRRFFVRPSPRMEFLGRKRSMWMATRQRTVACDCSSKKIAAGDASEYSEAPQRATTSRLVPTHQQDHRAIKQRCASMLGLKSFGSAAITLAGIELAHRIRKGQYVLAPQRDGRTASLKGLWCRALGHEAATPSMHQNSKLALARTVRTNRSGKVRYPHKVSFGRNLYMLVMPKGGRYWRYCYRYDRKRKTLALGTYPDVPIDRARSRHQAARQLLAAGVDPSLKRFALRRLSNKMPALDEAM